MKKYFLPTAALAGALLMGLGPMGWTQGEPQETPVVTVKAEPSKLTIAPGGKATLLLHLAIAPKFHINSNPASDEDFIPAEVRVSAAQGVHSGKPIYPAGQKKMFAFSPTPVSVYEGRVIVKVPLSVAAGTKPGVRVLTGTVGYQACDDNSCLMPDSVPFKMQVVIKSATKSVVPKRVLSGASARKFQAKAAVASQAHPGKTSSVQPRKAAK
jgi:hypothetical protein